MKNNKTLIGICLDASASMRDLKRPVIEGFNSYLSDLQGQDLNAKISVMRFSTDGQASKDPQSPVDVADFPPLTSYYTEGWTPLYDAIGKMIKKMEPEVDEETGVLLVVQTDGNENRSYTYSQAKIQALVEAKAKEGWKFLYIGVGLGKELARSQAVGLGMSPGSVRSVSRNATLASFAEMTKATAAL